MFIFACFYVYFVLKGYVLYPDRALWLFPVVLGILAVLGLGLGMLISSLTTKYRDFRILIGFATTLLMYVSAVMYPIAEVYNSTTLSAYAWLIELNPIAILIEAFRYMTLQEGLFDWGLLGYCGLLSLVVFFIGLIVFNRTGRNFIDTI